VEIIERTVKEYEKMNSDERDKLVWNGAKALIAGAMKYNFKKSMPSIYSLILENSPWQATVDCAANILKKYGGEKTVQEVIQKAVGDVDAILKEGGKNPSAT